MFFSHLHYIITRNVANKVLVQDFTDGNLGGMGSRHPRLWEGWLGGEVVALVASPLNIITSYMYIVQYFEMETLSKRGDF